MSPVRTPARNDVANAITCAACGALQTREKPGVCEVCGKLMSEGFQPLDTIRSSYGLQRRPLPNAMTQPPESLFEPTPRSIVDTAWACTVYSMVPYLGILFIPFAIGVGSAAYVSAKGAAAAGQRNTAAFSIGVSLVLLAIQLVLWWLLYLIPEIGI